MSRGEERRSTPPSGRPPFKAVVLRGGSTSTVTGKGIWRGMAASIGRSLYTRSTRTRIGKPLPIGLRVRDIDAAGDAVDMAARNLAIAHQLDAGWVADADRLELSLKVSVRSFSCVKARVGVSGPHSGRRRRARFRPSRSRPLRGRGWPPQCRRSRRDGQPGAGKRAQRMSRRDASAT